MGLVNRKKRMKEVSPRMKTANTRPVSVCVRARACVRACVYVFVCICVIMSVCVSECMRV